jgi:hypothetical protein
MTENKYLSLELRTRLAEYHFCINLRIIKYFL